MKRFLLDSWALNENFPDQRKCKTSIRKCLLSRVSILFDENEGTAEGLGNNFVPPLAGNIAVDARCNHFSVCELAHNCRGFVCLLTLAQYISF